MNNQHENIQTFYIIMVNITTNYTAMSNQSYIKGGNDMDEKIKWPNGAKCAVMLTFDVDGETLFVEGPEGADWYYPRSRAFGRYGPHRGVDHILEILEAENVRSTFFIPGRTAADFPDMVKAVDEAGHEIGCHGYDHELFADYSLKEQEEIIKRSQEVIYSQTGKTFKGFRTPSGDPTAETSSLLQKLGFTYSSSMRGDDRPYRTVLDNKASDLIEIPAKWELDDYPQLSYDFFPAMPISLDRIKGYHQVLDNWKREFDGYYKYGYHYVIMFHPQIIGTPGKIVILEELIKYIKSFPDVWFATGSEIADWWKQNY